MSGYDKILGRVIAHRHREADIIRLARNMGTNVLYVALWGNDSSAMANHREQAYKTIQAAMNAATAGDWLIILPGIFDENVLHRKDINMYFEYGAKIIVANGYCIKTEDPAQGSGDFTLAGYGYFESKSDEADAGDCLNFLNSSGARQTCYLQFDKALCYSMSALNMSGYNLIIHANEISGNWDGDSIYMSDCSGTVNGHTISKLTAPASNHFTMLIYLTAGCNITFNVQTLTNASTAMYKVIFTSSSTAKFNGTLFNVDSTHAFCDLVNMSGSSSYIQFNNCDIILDSNMRIVNYFGAGNLKFKSCDFTINLNTGVAELVKFSTASPTAHDFHFIDCHLDIEGMPANATLFDYNNLEESIRFIRTTAVSSTANLVNMFKNMDPGLSIVVQLNSYFRMSSSELEVYTGGTVQNMGSGIYGAVAAGTTFSGDAIKYLPSFDI